MKQIIPILTLFTLTAGGFAQAPDTTRLEAPKSDVRNVLAFYERITKKPVFAALDPQAVVAIKIASRNCPGGDIGRMVERPQIPAPLRRAND